MPSRRAVTRVVVSTASTLFFFATARGELSCGVQSRSKIQPTIDTFLIRPETTLERYPRGDADRTSKEMQISIRELVAADIEHTLDRVMALIPIANGHQKQAIGAGLGDAARQCDRVARPADAGRLFQAIKRSNSKAALMAFMTSYTDAPASPDLGPTDYTPPTNPLGNGNVASPSENVFKQKAIRSPFTLSDPFAPVK